MFEKVAGVGKWVSFFFMLLQEKSYTDRLTTPHIFPRLSGKAGNHGRSSCVVYSTNAST